MRPETLRRILDDVASGRLEPADAARRLSWLPIEEVGGSEHEPVFARLDHHRSLRQGVPEVVFCPGKTEEQIVEICRRLAGRGNGFLATRAGEAVRRRLASVFSGAVVNDTASTVHLAGEARPSAPPAPTLVVSAGTGDVPVAEEAAATADALGHEVQRLFDVGVAGLHRVLSQSELLQGAGVVIVVAGMEGALPSVVGGLVSAPVVAVPTSIGYGAAFGGLAALLGMLNSCAAGVVVVNIDNGFGAAFAADRIQRSGMRSVAR